MSHFEERLEQDLAHIRDSVSEMSEKVQAALASAVKALRTHDLNATSTTVLGDYSINRASRDLDQLCHAFIARHLPSAGHLRLISSTIRVNVALERIGDYAVTICREALQLEALPKERLARALDTLADESKLILRQAMDYFLEGNLEGARALTPIAQRVEDMMDDIYADIMEPDDDADPRTLIASFVVFSLLKRVSDQAKNICEQTIFAVSGEVKRTRVFQILFLDRTNRVYAQMAAALARKRFHNSGQYQCAALQPAEAVDSRVVEFLQQRGAPSNFITRGLDVHDLTQFDVVVSLQGPLGDYVDKLPFHTTGLEWTLPEAPGDCDESAIESVYRELMPQIEGLLHTLVGKDAD